MPLGPVVGFRGQTHVKVDWKIVPPAERDGSVRYIEGIAYNAAIKGERRRVTCSSEVWNNPDEDVFYGDEAVRWTEGELRAMRLHGIPLRVLHTDLPPVGMVIDNWVDNAGHLHIFGELYGNTEYGRTAIGYLDSGACHELSIGYPISRDRTTGVVTRLGVDEISIVTEAHFRGCKVNIKAGRGVVVKPEAPYTVFEAIRQALTTDSAPEASSSLPRINMSQTANVPPALRGVEQPPLGVPPELAEAYSRAVRQLMNTTAEKDAMATEKDALAAEKAAMAAELEKIKKEKDALAKRQAELDAADAAAREEHARAIKPQSDEIVGNLKKIVTEQGLAGLSDQFVAVEQQMHADINPLSKEMTAVRVACMRKIRKTEEELEQTKAKLVALEAERRLTSDMAMVDEAERGEMRAVKAGRRNAAAATAAREETEEAPAARPLSSRPPWLQFILQPAGSSMFMHPAHRTYSNQPPIDTRMVQAGRNASTASQQPAAATEHAIPRQQQQHQQMVEDWPLARYGAPRPSNWSGSVNREFNQHFKDVLGDTTLDNAFYHFAGREIPAPTVNLRTGH